MEADFWGVEWWGGELYASLASVSKLAYLVGCCGLSPTYKGGILRDTMQPLRVSCCLSYIGKAGSLCLGPLLRLFNFSKIYFHPLPYI